MGGCFLFICKFSHRVQLVLCVVFVLPVTLNPLLTYCLDFQEQKLLIKTGSYQKRSSTSGRDSTGWATGTRRKKWCCPSLTSRLYRRTPWWVGSSDTHAIGMPVLSVTINLEPWRLALSFSHLLSRACFWWRLCWFHVTWLSSRS